MYACILLHYNTKLSIIGNSSAWYLEARPSSWYIQLGRSVTITCYNISSTTILLPRNSLWYKIVSNGTLQQLSTDLNNRVRSDGSQLQISSTKNEDHGTYCCKGPLQALDACDDSATANITILIPPIIIPGKNQTVFVRNDAIMECIIEDVGNPPFVAYRWQKSGQRLIADGTKYTSWLIGNETFLTIVNSTTDDEGYYQCILETSNFEIQEAFVYLSVNYPTITHSELNNGGSLCNYIVIFLNYTCHKILQN